MADQKPGGTVQRTGQQTGKPLPPKTIVDPRTGKPVVAPYGTQVVTLKDGTKTLSNDPAYVKEQQDAIAAGNAPGFLDKVGDKLNDPMTYVDPVHAITGLPTPVSVATGAVKGAAQGYEDTGTVGGALGGAARGAGGSVVDDLKGFGSDVVAGATGKSPSGGTAAAASGAPAPPNLAGLSPADQALALQQYRDAIAKSNAQYDEILNYKPNPTANDTFHAVTAPQVTAQQAVASGYTPATAKTVGYSPTDAATATTTAAQVSPSARLKAALQDQTTVQGTGLDTGQSDQSRQLQLGALGSLQDTAAGGGAGADLAAARTRQLLAQSGAQANGLVQQARGNERRGARLSAILSSGANNLAGETQIQAQNASDRLAAQQAVVGATQGIRSTDVTQATTKAQLDQQRNTLQAQLDSAKASNDQNAINAIQTKMADLDAQQQQFNATSSNTVGLANTAATNQGNQFNATQRTTAAQKLADATNQGEQFNATQENAAGSQLAGAQTAVSQSNTAQGNTVATGNADRTVQTGESNNTQGLAAQATGEQQRVANENLKLQASAAAQQAAKGLLDENGRQQTLALAQAQLKLAQTQADRQFWGNLVSSLLSGATAVGAAALTAAPVAAALKHGGLVTKPTHALIGEAGPELVIPVKGATARLAKVLGIEAKPFQRKGAPSLSKMASLLAAATIKAKKEAQV